MTKLTKNQRATIVRLFASGTSMSDLAQAHGVDLRKVEQIIREAFMAQEAGKA